MLSSWAKKDSVPPMFLARHFVTFLMNCPEKIQESSSEISQNVWPETFPSAQELTLFVTERTASVVLRYFLMTYGGDTSNVIH